MYSPSTYVQLILKIREKHTSTYYRYMIGAFIYKYICRFSSSTISFYIFNFRICSSWRKTVKIGCTMYILYSVYQGSVPSVFAFTNKNTVPEVGQGPNFPYEKGIWYNDSIYSNPDIFFKKNKQMGDIAKEWPIHYGRQKICKKRLYSLVGRHACILIITS